MEKIIIKYVECGEAEADTTAFILGEKKFFKSVIQ